MAKAPDTIKLNTEIDVVLNYDRPKIQSGDRVEWFDPNSRSYIYGTVTELVQEGDNEGYAVVDFEDGPLHIFPRFLNRVLPLPTGRKEAAAAALAGTDEDAKAAAQADEIAAAFPLHAAETEEYRFTDKVEHYNQHPSGVECQEIIRECKDPLVAFAMKHLWRSQWGNKPGAPKELDLKKAIEYLQLELAREQGEKRL